MRAWVVGVVLVTGCKSPCVKLCDTLATYAEECGLAVPEADVDACAVEMKEATAEEKGVCRDYGDPETLRSQWTCDDLQVYWDAPAGT